MNRQLSFYWQRFLTLVGSLESVQRYRLKRAYMLDAYDERPGLRQHMFLLWVKLALFVLTGLVLARLASTLHIDRTALVLVYSFVCVGLFIEARQVNRQDYAVMLTFREYCERSKFLGRKTPKLIRKTRLD